MIYIANLVRLIFTIYIILVFVRFILAFMRPSMFNPIVRFVYNATDPYLRLFAGVRLFRIGSIDFSLIIALFLLYFLRELCYVMIKAGYISLDIFLDIVMWNLYKFVGFILLIFVTAVGLRLILEAIGLRINNVLVSMIYSISETAVKPVRDIIKLNSIRGFDPSLIISLAGLVLLRFLLLPKLRDLILMLIK